MDVIRAVDAIQSLIQSLRVSGRAVERQSGISSAQLSILQALAEQPAQSVNDLANSTYTHQSSVSLVVRRLIDKGLVRRRSSEADARRVSLSLTQAGRTVIRRAPAAAPSRLIASLQSLSRADIRNLADSLEAIAKEVTRQSPQ